MQNKTEDNQETEFSIKQNIQDHWAILTAMFLSGAAALTYEVAASQALLYFFNASTYSVATVLSSFLFGLAVGSLLMSKYLNRIKNKQKVFALIEFLIGVYALMFLIKLDLLPAYLLNLGGVSLIAAKFMVSFVYLLIPTLLLGALFPLACSLMADRKTDTGSTMGLLYAFDTFGAVFGAAISGFALIPMLGLTASIAIAGAMSLIAGLLIIREAGLYLFGCLIAMALFVFLLGIDDEDIAIDYQGNAIIIERDSIIFEKNSPYGTVRVVDDGNGINLYTGKRWHCASNSTNVDAEFATILLDNLERENIKILHIGIGCGYTLEAMLRYDNVAQVDLVEINSAVLEAEKIYFSELNNKASSDPKVTTFIEDGTTYLRRTDKKYDAIIITVQIPDVVYSSPLYTVEFFKIINELLTPGGLFVTYTTYSYENDKILYDTFREAFPYVFLSNTHMIGSNKYRELSMTESDKELIKKLHAETEKRINTLDNQILRNR